MALNMICAIHNAPPIRRYACRSSAITPCVCSPLCGSLRKCFSILTNKMVMTSVSAIYKWIIKSYVYIHTCRLSDACYSVTNAEQELYSITRSMQYQKLYRWRDCGRFYMDIMNRYTYFLNWGKIICQGNNSHFLRRFM